MVEHRLLCHISQKRKNNEENCCIYKIESV